jgi:hypothetical protein
MRIVKRESLGSSKISEIEYGICLNPLKNELILHLSTKKNSLDKGLKEERNIEYVVFEEFFRRKV